MKITDLQTLDQNIIKFLAEHHSEIKKRIGYVPDTPDIFLQLSPKEYWNLKIGRAHV